MKFLITIALFIFTLSTQAVTDTRMCGEVKRTVDGKIKRDGKVTRSFKKLYPCPSNMSSTGSCPGWAMDHVIPLACGGCDTIENLQWLPLDIKSKAGKLPKDRWERNLYCNFAKPISVQEPK